MFLQNASRACFRRNFWHSIQSCFINSQTVSFLQFDKKYNRNQLSRWLFWFQILFIFSPYKLRRILLQNASYILSQKETIQKRNCWHNFYIQNYALQSDSHLLKIRFICCKESPLKMGKNAFYFILKAFFVLKILKFLFDFFVM